MDQKVILSRSEFKMQTVLLSLKSNNIAQLARDLNIRLNRLHEWRRLFKEFGDGSFPGPGIRRVNPDKKELLDLEKKLKEAKLDLEIIKKGHQFMFGEKDVLYNFIKMHEGIYPVKKMCKILGTGLTTYKTWKKDPLTKTQKRVLILRNEITSIFFENKQRHGAVLIRRELLNRGFQISECQVSFHMKELCLRSKIKRKFVATTDSKHNLYIAPNILKRNFNIVQQSVAWVSDITYIQTEKCFLYLTIIMDLYDRKIVGWNLDYNLATKNTVIPAFEMALKRRQVNAGLIFHSDRGAQYASRVFTNYLDNFKCIRSMSRTGDHLDNAAAESFFNTFKRELIRKQTRLLSSEEMKAKIFDFIEVWYNKKRIHSALNYKTIPEFNPDF